MEASLIARLEKAVERLEKLEVGPAAAAVRSAPATGAVPSPANGGAASVLAEWDHLMAEHFAPAKAMVPHLPPQAQQSMQSFERAFQATRRVLEVSTVAKKPDSPAELQSLLAPVAEAMSGVTGAAEGRQLTCPNHLKVLAEAVGALGFLAYTGTGCGMSPPRQHVADSWQSAEFFSNKLLMEFRGKDDNQVAWVRSVKTLLQQLEQFVVRNCPTGLKFDPNGVTVAAALAGGGAVAAKPAPATTAAPPAAAPAAPAPAAGSKPAGPPPPPPPGPPPKPLSLDELGGAGGGGAGGGAAAESGGMAALFKELSKGEGITSGLRKVTADMKSKNNPDRSGTVPATATATAAGSAAPPAAAAGKGQPAGPPKLELKGTKWVVEHHVGRKDLVVDNPAPKNSVYVFGCLECVVQIKGKVNAVTLDNCRRVGLVCEAVISSVEAVNCSSLQLQTTGTVPTISVEKTDGAQLFLSKQCASDPNFQIVSAKSSGVNVVVLPAPDEEAEGDPQEHPIPEQYISTFQGGKLVTVAAEHSGA